LIWIIQNNTNSTNFSHFLSSLGWRSCCKFLPLSVFLWPSAPHRPLTRPLPCSTGLHFASSWWLETEDWSSQTILAENGGGWPVTNEPRTGGVEAACSGQIGMAETRDNGYVYDKLLKKKKSTRPISCTTKDYIYKSWWQLERTKVQLHLVNLVHYVNSRHTPNTQ